MDFDFEANANLLRTPHQRFPTLAPRANLRPVTTTSSTCRTNSTSNSRNKKDSLMLEIDYLQSSCGPSHSTSYPVTSKTIVSTSDDANDSDVSSIGTHDDDDDEFLLCTPSRFSTAAGSREGGNSAQRSMSTPYTSVGSSPFSLTPRKMTAAELPHIPAMISPLPPTPQPERERNPKRKIGMCYEF